MRRSVLHLDAVFEFHTKDYFWQEAGSIQPSPAALGGLKQFEHHGDCRVIRQAALGADRAMPNGCEGAFDRVRAPCHECEGTILNLSVAKNIAWRICCADRAPQLFAALDADRSWAYAERLN